MNRQEKSLVVVTTALVVLFVVVLASGIAHWLNQQPWWGDGANFIQWSGGISTFAGISAIVYWRWTHRCGAPRCIRLGEHPVKGTRRKVCHKHHSRGMHELVHDLHRIEGLLGWGESHDR